MRKWVRLVILFDKIKNISKTSNREKSQTKKIKTCYSPQTTSNYQQSFSFYFQVTSVFPVISVSQPMVFWSAIGRILS